MDLDESKFRKVQALKAQQRLLDANEIVLSILADEYEDCSFDVKVDIEGELIKECKLQRSPNGAIELFVKAKVLGNLRLTQRQIMYGLDNREEMVPVSVYWTVGIGWSDTPPNNLHSVNEVYNRIISVIKLQVYNWVMDNMDKRKAETFANCPSLKGKTCYIKL